VPGLMQPELTLFISTYSRMSNHPNIFRTNAFFLSGVITGKDHQPCVFLHKILTWLRKISLGKRQKKLMTILWDHMYFLVGY